MSCTTTRGVDNKESEPTGVVLLWVGLLGDRLLWAFSVILAVGVGSALMSSRVFVVLTWNNTSKQLMQLKKQGL